MDIILIPETNFHLPSPLIGTAFANSVGYVGNDGSSATKLKDWFLSQAEITFNVRLEKSVGSGQVWVIPQPPSFAVYELQGDPSTRSFSRWAVGRDKTISFNGFVNTHENTELGVHIASTLMNRIYIFRAERFNAGSCGFGRNPVLAPNAQNLAEVLGILQHNRSRFALFNKLVRQIFPQVHWISVRPHPQDNQTLEIVVWNHDPETEREDLAVPLNESGTGIGQVLAILYVVLTSSYSRTIIIDEPQSFLHRGAARKLVEILKSYPQHQFIISTHSPTIITATNPKTITLVRQRDGESITEILNAEEIEQQRLYLAEIGARPMDVFGADNILWVEGETEEECFPKILESIAHRSLMGTVIRGIKHTGDLEGKHADLVFEIYDRLSHSKSLLPPALGFILDDEGRSSQQKTEIEHKSHERAFFIPRRMYENYLLNPEAIATVANQIEGFRETPLTSNEVRALLEAKRDDAKYYRPLAVPATADDQWITTIHGARVLADIFSELSEARVSYDKLRHSGAITEWLIEHTPEDLREIADLLEQILTQSS